MTSAEALATIRRAAAARALLYTVHARQRMAERGATAEDVRTALASATACRAADGGRWKADGVDLDGDELVAVVAIEGDVVVVTVF